MPRHVDPVERRAEITTAAMRVLGRGGPQALTLKSLAEELGGSVTLVTHFIANRKELFTALTDDLTEGYEEELERREEGARGVERLWSLVTWLCPMSKDEIEREQARVALISHRHEHPSIEHFFDAMESRMRSLLRNRLTEVVPADEVEHATEYLRAVTNGVTLSAIEHPDMWPPARAEQVLRTALRGLGLEAPPSETSMNPPGEASWR